MKSKIKIIARMRGGLGNQLFIISFSYYLRSLVNKACDIELDLREYVYYKTRNFELNSLFLEPPGIYEDHNLKYDINRKLFHLVSALDNSNYKKISNHYAKKGMYFSKRNGYDFVFYTKDVYYIYGYYQDARMALKVKKKILDNIDSKSLNYFADNKKKKICVSVRVGDDYKAQGWPICSKEYFKRAIDEIVEEKYKNIDYSVIVFSDDISKAKEYFYGDSYEYIEGLTAPDQLRLMLQCDDFIASNSSFSWWGAFLGKKDNSIVIFPSKWYPKEDTNRTLLVFDNVRIRNIE